VDGAVKAFAVLRAHASDIIQYCDLAFRLSGLPITKAASYLERSLFLDLDLGQACAKVRRIVESSPNDVRTRLKNKMHSLNVTSSGLLMGTKSSSS